MRLAVGLLLALAASAALNVSFYVQHEAASGLPSLSLRRPFHSLLLLFGNLKWFLGWAAGWAGWALYIAALVFAPLSLAQAVAAGGVGFIALLAWLRHKRALSRIERRAVLACLLGLGLIALSVGAVTTHSARAGWVPISWWVGGCVIAAAVFAGPLRSVVARGAGLGAAAGLLYAGGDIATKGAVSSAGLVFVLVLVACHVVGFVALQLSFQQGSALATAGLSAVLNNTVPIAAGVVVFHERLPGGAFGVLRVLGFAFVVLGAALLAKQETPPVTGAEPSSQAGGPSRPDRLATRSRPGRLESRRPSALQ